MSTRSIVTSQPDVACDVCGRRLLRGEQPDTFLAAGEPRTVCELCTPRAAHQGWKRGSAEHALQSPPPGQRRGRGLFERLLQSRRPAGAPEPEPISAATEPLARDLELEPYDFLTVDGVAPARQGAGEPAPAAATEPARSYGPLQRAAAVFNASEYPRRVASLTRSLGAPEVTVRPGEAVASAVVIVLAWELCWYSYEVDVDDMQGPQARAIAQGTELHELGSEDRLANASADERGALSLN